jgi:hypothetical protein
MLAEMGGKSKVRPKRYREFVEAGLKEEDEDFKGALTASPRSVGGDSFREWVDEIYQKLVEKSDVKEDVSFRSITEPMEARQVLEVLAEALDVEVEEFSRHRRNSVLRGIAGRLLIRYSGLTQRTVAELLGVATGASISVQMRRAGEALAADRVLSRQVDKAMGRLAELRKSEKQGKRVNAYFKG